MKKIIPPVDKQTIKRELRKIRFIRNTVRGNNEIYSFTCRDSAILMDEVGRLREESFRAGGGGTGKDKDIDKFDLGEVPFHQLILWDPENEQIMGGYRYLMGRDVKNDENGVPVSPTSKLFRFSDEFLKKYWPDTMELGRSFVQPLYQPSVNRKKGIYALDNLWDGLGSMVVDFPSMKYFFGKMTMYTSFNRKARDLILCFIEKHFPDREKLVSSNYPITLTTPRKEIDSILTGRNYKEDYKLLNMEVRALNEYIPPLFSAYMNLSRTMKSFGTAINEAFGSVEETGIMITINDIFREKVNRYVASYVPANSPESDYGEKQDSRPGSPGPFHEPI
jgi:hypothetical protein